MLTSKERAELRAKANSIDTTLIVGKGGVSESLVADVEIQLDNRELVKGKVLETSLMSAREASDAICEATGADGVSCVGNKFVIYRRLVAKAERERRNEYFRQQAIDKAIERNREKQLHGEE